MTPNVVYIAGYGRSGTTILDIILSCHDRVVSGGEIFRAAEIFSDENALCTCGELLSECQVWRNVRLEYMAESRAFGGLTQMQDAFMGFEGQRGHDRTGRVAGVWARLNRLSLQALAASKDDALWVVDSSKTARGAARRPRLLAENIDGKVRLLPVQRRAGAVVASARRGTNRAMEGGATQRDSFLRGMRAFAGWVMADAATRRAAQGMSTLPMLKHEDLIRDPDACYARVLAGLDLAPDTDWRNRLETETRHLIGGNRTRFEAPKIRVSDGVVPDSDMLTHIGRSLGGLLSKIGLS